MLRVLDLFSGIGGFSLGLERTGGFETVAFCEIDPFCRKVLAKHWPNVPCYTDVRELTSERLAADGIAVDVICGGFPCQDISAAGKKVGISGARSSLWSEITRLAGEIGPRFIVMENSSALLSRGFSEILCDLATRGYDAEWQCIPASALGAPHGRDRVWLVSYPNNESQSDSPKHDETRRMPPPGIRDVADMQRRIKPLGRVMAGIGRVSESISWDLLWDFENSPIGMGVDDGLPRRMDRLRSLGNAVVPQIPELLGRAILATQKEPGA